jgi:hypothetical protein
LPLDTIELALAVPLAAWFLTATSKAVIYLAMTRLLLRRLTRP